MSHCVINTCIWNNDAARSERHIKVLTIFVILLSKIKMRSFSICFTLFFITIGNCAPVDNDDSWSLFKQVHKKVYNSIEEELNR